MDEHFSKFSGYTWNEWKQRCVFERIGNENSKHEAYEYVDEDLVLEC